MSKMIKHDGFDAAILGVGSRCGQDDVLVYDYDKMVEIYAEREKCSPEEANDFVSYNANWWVGDGTPIVLYRLDPDEIEDRIKESAL